MGFASVGTLVHAHRVTTALSTGVPGTELELGSRPSGLPPEEVKQDQPKATRVSVHGFEGGGSRELWQWCRRGAFPCFVLCSRRSVAVSTLLLDAGLPVLRIGRVAKMSLSVPIFWFRGCLQSTNS